MRVTLVLPIGRLSELTYLTMTLDELPRAPQQRAFYFGDAEDPNTRDSVRLLADINDGYQAISDVVEGRTWIILAQEHHWLAYKSTLLERGFSECILPEWLEAAIR